jgi:hypothetical protein
LDKVQFGLGPFRGLCSWQHRQVPVTMTPAASVEEQEVLRRMRTALCRRCGSACFSGRLTLPHMLVNVHTLRTAFPARAWHAYLSRRHAINRGLCRPLDRDRSELTWLASTQQATPGFFHGMHPPVLKALFQRATYQHIASEQIIFSQGAPAQSAYLLLHGEADTYRAFEATGTICFARS